MPRKEANSVSERREPRRSSRLQQRNHTPPPLPPLKRRRRLKDSAQKNKDKEKITDVKSDEVESDQDKKRTADERDAENRTPPGTGEPEVSSAKKVGYVHLVRSAGP